MAEIAGAEALRPVINRMASAYGGRAALKSVNAHYARGSATVGGRRGSFRRYFQRGRGLRMDYSFQEGGEHLALCGGRAFRWAAEDTPEEAGRDGYLEALFEYRLLDLPRGILEGDYRVEYLGRAGAGGKKAEVLVLEAAEGPTMKVHVHAGSGLILRAECCMDARGTAAALAAEFSDYRKTGGVPFPMRTAYYRGGRKVREMVVENLIVNPGISGEVFCPP